MAWHHIWIIILWIFTFPAFLAHTPSAHADLIAYVTDLEGSRMRFLQFLSQSNAFNLGSDGKYHLKPGAKFVFGGDAPDRFLGSLWVVEELVRLKTEAIKGGLPHAVTLIAGNRDINKMRLTSEVSELALKKLGIASRTTHLKHIFENTMGAPYAFELRRQELALRQNQRAQSVTDYAVAESFLEELGPQGAFAKFLELSQLVGREGSTLFVHGGMTLENLGLVPHGDDPQSRIEDIDLWIDKLNQWYHQEVRAWAENRFEWAGEGPRPGERIISYPMPKPGARSRPDSVVNARNADLLNNPLLPDQKVIDFLLAHGINRIVIGHTPTGDAPVFIRTPDGRFEVISADNSRTRSEKNAAILEISDEDEFRATALSTVHLENGDSIECIATSHLGQASLLGQRTQDGALIVGQNRANPNQWVSFKYAENFHVTHLAHEVECARAISGAGELLVIR